MQKVVCMFDEVNASFSYYRAIDCLLISAVIFQCMKSEMHILNGLLSIKMVAFLYPTNVLLLFSHLLPE